MDLSQITIVVIPIVLLFFVYRYLFVNNNYWRKNGIPCVDGTLPFIGNNWPLLQWRHSFVMLYYNYYRSSANYSMIGYYDFHIPGLIIRDPELVKTVTLTEFHNFDENTASLDPHLDPLLTNDPFFSFGEKWKRNRAILSNALSTKKLKCIGIQLHDIGLKFSEYIKGQVAAESGCISRNIHSFFSRFSAEFVANVAFGVNGRSFTEEPNNFATTVKSMYQPASSYEFLQILGFYFPILSKILRIRLIPKKIDNYFRQVIKHVLQVRRKTKEFTNDFLQQLIDSYHNEGDDQVNENAVTSLASTFFLDGFLSSSIAMSFTAYEIAAHPTVQTKLREEITNIFEKYNGEITYESLQEMKYMDQVINEALRLFPPIPYLGKICTKEVKLVGADGLECIIQPGTEVIICTIGLHRDPLFWENPNVFDPERFSDDKKNERHKYIYLPFGSGPRTCVGMRVARMQMKAAFATLLKNYSIEVDPKTKGPIELHPLSGLFTIPHNELWLRIKPLE